MSDPFGLQGTIQRANAAANTANYWPDYFKNQMKTARTPIDLNTANQDQSRAQQQDLIQQLHRLAQGDPNSLAQQQLRQSMQMAQGQVGGGLAARGNLGGAGATMRQAGAVQGSLGRQGMDQSRVLQMQEQAAAQQALAQAYAAQHGQDVGLANDLAQTNLRNTALNDQFYQGMAGLGQQGLIGNYQTDLDAARAKLGFMQDTQDMNRRWMQSGMNAAATGAGVLSGMNWGGNSSGYRQVGGQNSIVPDWDK